MTIDEIKRELFSSSEDVLGNDMVDLYEAQECCDTSFNIGYNKAIDDFVKEICKIYVQSERNGNYRFYAVEIKQAIADLAEQLKVGERDEF